MVAIWDFITNFFTGLSEFWTWLNEPIEELNNWQPISIIGVSGLAIILGFWIFKLVWPLS